MPDFVVGTRFKAFDQMKTFWKRNTASAVKFGNEATRQFKRASMAATGFKNITKGILAAGAVQRGLGLLSQGVGSVTRDFISFDDAIFAATARFKAAEKPGTDMKKVMNDLRVAARKTGSATQFTAAQAAKGLDKFALAGFNSKEAIASLRSIIDLTTATGEDFTRVSDISTDLLGAFGGAALKSAEKVKFLKEMNALLAVATLSANVTMEDLFETLKIAAPIATQLGINMKDVIATTSVLGSAGIKGSIAATALKNVMLNLVDPASKSAKALGKLGIAHSEIVTKQGKLKPMSQIFNLIGEKMKSTNKTAIQQAAIFKELFGLRGIAGAAVIAKNLPAIRKQLIAMGKDPQKVLMQTADFMRKSMGNRIKILGSAATELGFKFFQAFAGKGKKGIDDLTKSIQKFDVKPIVFALKTFFTIVSFLFNILKPFLPILLTMVVVTKLWAAAQAILNVILTANPIGLIIMLVGALIIAFIQLVHKTGSIGGAFKALGLIILQALVWPINMVLTHVKFMFFLLSKLPGKAGTAMKGVFDSISGIQTKFNAMFAARGVQPPKSPDPVAPNQGTGSGVNVKVDSNVNVTNKTDSKVDVTNAPPILRQFLGAQS